MNCYTFDDLEIGHQESLGLQITQEMMDLFCTLTGDTNPLHTDEAYARGHQYQGRVAYGLMTASFTSTLAGMLLPGKYSLIHGVEYKFLHPVYCGDQLTITGTVTEKDDRFKLLVIRVDIHNQKRDKVCKGIMRVGVMDGNS